VDENHKMESNLFDFEEVKRSPRFGIKQFVDAVYKGELVQGLRHG